jgi:hypothetical protein
MKTYASNRARQGTGNAAQVTMAELCAPPAFFRKERSRLAHFATEP